MCKIRSAIESVRTSSSPHLQTQLQRSRAMRQVLRWYRTYRAWRLPLSSLGRGSWQFHRLPIWSLRWVRCWCRWGGFRECYLACSIDNWSVFFQEYGRTRKKQPREWDSIRESIYLHQVRPGRVGAWSHRHTPFCASRPHLASMWSHAHTRSTSET